MDISNQQYTLKQPTTLLTAVVKHHAGEVNVQLGQSAQAASTYIMEESTKPAGRTRLCTRLLLRPGGRRGGGGGAAAAAGRAGCAADCTSLPAERIAFFTCRPALTGSADAACAGNVARACLCAVNTSSPRVFDGFAAGDSLSERESGKHVCCWLVTSAAGGGMAGGHAGGITAAMPRRRCNSCTSL